MATTKINAGQIVGTAGQPEASEVVKLDSSRNLGVGSGYGIASLTASAGVSASYFEGYGGNLTGVSSDSVDVTEKDDNVAYRFVGVANSGLSVELVCDDDNAFTFNPSTAAANLPGALAVAGAVTLNGAVTLGNAAGDDITNTGRWVGDFVPKTDSSIDLGTSTLQFAEAHVDSGYIDNLSGSGALQMVGAAIIQGDVTTSGSFVIGNASMNEADLEKLDGITNGTAAASKAVVLDGSKDVAGINNLYAASGGFGALGATTVDASGAGTFGGNVTAVGSFIIGSADMNEADLEQLDGITAGTAAGSKAVVLDASKNIATLGTVGCGAITSTGASSFGATTLTSLNNSSGGITNAGSIAGATSIDASGDLTVGTITNTEFTVDASGNTDIDGTLNVEGVPTFQAESVHSAGATFNSAGLAACGAIAGATTISGSLTLSGNQLTIGGSYGLSKSGAAAIASMSTDWTNAGITVADLGTVTTVDINGGSVDGSTLGGDAAVTLSGCTLSVAEGDVNVAADAMLFRDADDSDLAKRESLVHLAAAQAGDGVQASSGQFSLSWSKARFNKAAGQVAQGSTDGTAGGSAYVSCSISASSYGTSLDERPMVYLNGQLQAQATGSDKFGDHRADYVFHNDGTDDIINFRSGVDADDEVYVIFVKA